MTEAPRRGGLGELARFFKGWMEHPLLVGSVFPTGRAAARGMASVADPGSSLPVLELGPGTGVVTQALIEHGVAPERLWCVEHSADFTAYLADRFPSANVLQGDALALDEALGEARDLTFDCVVSGVPLYSFPAPRRVTYVLDLLGRVPAGRPVVQITFSPVSPLPAGAEARGIDISRFRFVLANLPPAHLWLYRRREAA